MDADDTFVSRISRRTDVDPNGYFDIVAHGTSNSIQITHNGEHILVDHRVAAQLIQNADGYNGQPIRLLSCNTGSLDDGFAQNLANTLNVDVMAPTKYVCANPDGSYFISGIRRVGNITVSDGNMGEFRVFTPGGNR